MALEGYELSLRLGWQHARGLSTNKCYSIHRIKNLQTLPSCRINSKEREIKLPIELKDGVSQKAKNNTKIIASTIDELFLPFHLI